MNLAQEQAAIKAYWERFGYEVETELVDTGVRNGVTGTKLLGVRSNLINALPPGMIRTMMAKRTCIRCSQFKKRGLAARCVKCDELNAQVPVRKPING